MPLETIITKKWRLKDINIPTKAKLIEMEEDCNRVIAGNEGDTKLFSPAFVNVCKSILVDIKKAKGVTNETSSSG